MVQTLSQQVAATEQGKWLLQQEDAILDVTELICEIMSETSVSRSELARRRVPSLQSPRLRCPSATMVLLQATPATQAI